MSADLTTKQRLALSICDFLTSSLSDGTLKSDAQDSVDIAVNCIAEVFKVDLEDTSKAIGPQSLAQIFAVYETLNQAKGTMDGVPAASAIPEKKEVSPEDAAEAESLKSKGNAAMAAKDPAGAIELYTQALALVPGNAVYLSNRAAAHSAAKDHESAKTDATAAVTADPTYTKGWSRLGLALFALGDAQGAMDAYAKGIEHEGNGGSEAMRKGYETAKKRVEEGGLQRSAAPSGGAGAGAGMGAGGMPDLASMAGMFGGGSGGMPDLGSIMSNPMFQSMANNLMSNPDMMASLMSNPRMRAMAESLSGGGGMPDLSSMMNDPSIAEAARNMMGGAGRGSPPS